VLCLYRAPYYHPGLQRLISEDSLNVLMSGDVNQQLAKVSDALNGNLLSVSDRLSHATGLRLRQHGSASDPHGPANAA
jgi:hypothetical protein